jgi:putative membrane-bound dehydrogenase-like protein
MHRWTCLLSLGFVCLVAYVAVAQVPPEKAVATFTVSDGLEMTLWASEPLFVNPTCIDIDDKGRVWVCESVNYRHKLHHLPARRPEGDRIVILEDSHGTGHADKATTFYQSPDTLAPLGIAIAKDVTGPGYKVYVCQSPDILVFEDKDGDGKADGPPRKLLSGFGGFDHDHGVHGILIGPDGKLYFSVGDQGVHGLPGKNGKRWTTNHTDCQGGTIWRCDLDGSNLELVAHNFRNEYEPCVDSFGTVFVSDNDDDGNQQTRICYVMPGGNYGYWPRGPKESHWHEEQPGIVPKILRTYFGSPTGICVYEGSLLPEKYRGQLLHTDAGPRHVRCYHLTPQGAGYAVEREDMVTSTDNWFRPSDVCVALDGSVYVADWYDPGVGGHGIGDFTRGRIFRLAPKGNRPSVPKVDLNTNEGRLAALASPNRAVRYMAMGWLQSACSGNPTDAFTVLNEALSQGQSPVLRARALWQVAALYQAKKNPRRVDPMLDRHVRREALQDPDARFRICAIRILHDLGVTPADYPQQEQDRLCHDPSPAVRRELLLNLRDAKPESARPLILQLALGYEGKDRFYLEALGIAVGRDKTRRDVILADFDKHFPNWDDKVADIVWELRPPVVMPRLEEQLADAMVPLSQRCRIAQILNSVPDAEAGKALLRALQKDPPGELRDQVLDILVRRLSADWFELRQSEELARTVQHLLSRSESRQASMRLIAATEKADYWKAAAQLAEDEGLSLSERQAAVRTLGLLPSVDAVQALSQLLQRSTAKPEFRLEIVQALASPLQHNLDRPGSRNALESLERLLVSKDSDHDLKQAALAALAGGRPGSLWLLDAAGKKRLSGVLQSDAGRLLRNSPYEDIRRTAHRLFPPPGKLDAKRLPSPAILAGRRGDAERGKQLLAKSVTSDLQCLKCHTIRGLGGSIGPDLSVIGQKASRENLFESILIPSKAIADQYIAWVIETKQGLTLTGLVVEETPDHLTLRDANGKDTRLDKKEIESRTKSPTSLMPAELAATMTEDDLVDLVEYLYSLKTPAVTLDAKTSRR